MITNGFATQCNIDPLNYNDMMKNLKQSVKAVIKVNMTKLKMNLMMVVL